MANSLKHLSAEGFKKVLKRHQLKATPQRLAVHEAMCTLIHASADMIAEQIASTSKVKIRVSSVYNILAQMTELGIYSHRMSGNNKMYFDAIPQRHLHLYDKVNHVHKDIVNEELFELILKKLARKSYKGYKIEDIEINIIASPKKKSTLKGR